MIIVFIVIAIALLIAGIICGVISDWEEWSAAITGAGVAALIVCIIVTCVLSNGLVKGKLIDDKIQMYEEENAQIEEQLSEMIEQYQEYESGIFKEVAPESSTTLINLYPELKADALVQKQIEVHIANNKKIKELKESQIDITVKKWWLYFGG